MRTLTRARQNIVGSSRHIAPSRFRPRRVQISVQVPGWPGSGYIYRRNPSSSSFPSPKPNGCTTSPSPSPPSLVSVAFTTRVFIPLQQQQQHPGLTPIHHSNLHHISSNMPHTVTYTRRTSTSSLSESDTEARSSRASSTSPPASPAFYSTPLSSFITPSSPPRSTSPSKMQSVKASHPCPHTSDLARALYKAFRGSQ